MLPYYPNQFWLNPPNTTPNALWVGIRTAIWAKTVEVNTSINISDIYHFNKSKKMNYAKIYVKVYKYRENIYKYIVYQWLGCWSHALVHGGAGHSHTGPGTTSILYTGIYWYKCRLVPCNLLMQKFICKCMHKYDNEFMHITYLADNVHLMLKLAY